MTRRIGTLLIVFMASLACAQSIQAKTASCPHGIMNRERVWSPDCHSYFVTSGSGAGAFRVTAIDVYSLKGKATYVNDALAQIRCDLAIETLGWSSVHFHDIRWLDSDRLRLEVTLVPPSGGASHADYSYVVNAFNGQILETTFPTHRNWNCSSLPQPTGGSRDLVVRRAN